MKMKTRKNYIHDKLDAFLHKLTHSNKSIFYFDDKLYYINCTASSESFESFRKLFTSACSSFVVEESRSVIEVAPQSSVGCETVNL